MSEQIHANDQLTQDKRNPPMNVHVKARTTSGGGIEWDVGFKSPPDKGKVEIDLPPDSGKHDLVFHLVPTHGLDIEFDTADPIWVAEGGPCPPASGINSTQVGIVDRSDRKLTISDANSGDARILRYQLNFIGAGPCDPIIKNGGGITGPDD
jgi:hypothetical protein